MLAVVVACALALERSYPDTAGLVVQVAVNAAVLNLVTLGVFLLRRRVAAAARATPRRCPPPTR